MAILALGAAPAWGINWPQTYHDAGHTGFNPDEITLSSANVSGLHLRWGQSVDCGTVAFALDEGTIYALGQGDCNGNWDLTSIDATTGAKGWTVVTGNGGNHPVVATNGKLIFSACGFKDTGGNGYGAICAYRKSTGHRVWQYSAACNCLPESGVQSGLVYSKGVVYFGYATGGCCSNEYIVAADAASGQVLWTSSVGGNNSLGSAAPAIGKGMIYFYCGNPGSVCAISQTDGTPVWSTVVGGGQIGITFVNGVVYANLSTTQGGVVALDASTGAQLWSYAYPDGWGGDDPVAVAQSVVYARSTNSKLYALRAHTGKLLWSVTGGQTASTASVANGVVYAAGGPCAGGCDAASAYDATSGAMLWTESSGDDSSLNTPPIIANGVLYVANDSACGNICAYALPSGTVRR